MSDRSDENHPWTPEDDEELRRRLDGIEDPKDRFSALADAGARLSGQQRDPPKPTNREIRPPPTPELRRERLENSGIKEAITAEDFDRLVADSIELYPTYALRVVKRWHSLFNGEVPGRRHLPYSILYGMPSRGKTLACGWLIAREGGVYVEAPEARRIGSSDHFAVTKERERLLKARVLVIDDMGTEKDDRDTQEAFFLLANRRQGLRNALTLWTANLALKAASDKPEDKAKRDALLTRYDDRIIRRWAHNGTFVEATGKDMRRGSP